MGYIGSKIYHFDEVDSTNDTAKELALGSEEGTVVIAEIQKKGRGSFGKSWFSPKGGIWLSIILKPQISPSQIPLLTFISGIAICRVIRKLRLNARIGWPNDVLIGNKKVCGILSEAGLNGKVNYVVVGIGINANVDIELFPEDLKSNATSLKQELGKEVSQEDITQKIFDEMEIVYNNFKKENITRTLKEWKKLSCTIKRKVEIRGATETIEGKALDIDKDGALIVKLKNGTIKKVIAGECRICH